MRKSGFAFSVARASDLPPAGYIAAPWGVLAVTFCGPEKDGQRKVLRGYRAARGKWRWVDTIRTVAVSDVFPTETAAREAWRRAKPGDFRQAGATESVL